MNALICHNERRREVVRQNETLNGLDYLEVGTDRRTLMVYFLGKAPVTLGPSNILIEGGRRIRDAAKSRDHLLRREYTSLCGR